MFQALKYALLGLHFLIHNLEGLFGFSKEWEENLEKKKYKNLHFVAQTHCISFCFFHKSFVFKWSQTFERIKQKPQKCKPNTNRFFFCFSAIWSNFAGYVCSDSLLIFAIFPTKDTSYSSFILEDKVIKEGKW